MMGVDSIRDLLIFDLDGTLIDSKKDLVHAVNAARAQFHLGPLDDETVATYVGNGAPALIQKALGPEAAERDVHEALDFFLAYYRDHMLDHTVLYPGVRKALDSLLDAGVAMAILTNKPVRFSRAIVEGLGVGAHFRQIYGGNSFEHKKPHPIGVETLLAECDCARAATVMVGDSAVDVQTARNANITACGVTWGFQPEGFAEHPPDLLIGSLAELADMVIQGAPR